MGIFATIQNKKKEAEYANWANRYPLTDDCVALQNLIDAAERQIIIEGNEFYAIKGIQIAKKNKAKRERDALRDYITDMRNYLKDLQCGISVIAITPAPAAALVAIPVQTTYGDIAIAVAQPVVVQPEVKVIPDAPIPVLPVSNAAPITNVDTAIAAGKADSGINKKYLVFGAAALLLIGGYLYFSKK